MTKDVLATDGMPSSSTKQSTNATTAAAYSHVVEYHEGDEEEEKGDNAGARRANPATSALLGDNNAYS